MSALVPIALFGWIPLVVLSFTVLQPRKAVIAAYLAGWLFLPVASYDLPGLPDYSKGSAINIGVALGALCFDTARVRVLRWRPLDAAVAIFCLSDFFSSLSNDLGAYDGVAAVVDRIITWGLPYVIGRAYFSDGPGMGMLAVGVALGGLIYAPLCWFEIRMSPQLHAVVYGFSPHSFAQAMRGGGYRPTVFLQHGLAVGLWMGAASLVAVSLWRGKFQSRLLRLPIRYVAVAMVLTAVMCKSTGASALMVTGIAAVWATRRYSTRNVLYALAVMPALYIPLRATGLWSGDGVVEWIEMVLPDRAASLGFRLDCENLLSARARERWLLGWGGWGRSSVRIPDDPDQSVITDSLWILVFGKQGAIGLVSMLGMLMLPVLSFARACPRSLWGHPRVAPALALAVVLSCYTIDNLFNDMPNPLYMLIAGGLGAVRFARPRAQSRPVDASRPVELSGAKT